MGCSFNVEAKSLSELAQMGAEREFTAQERKVCKRLVTKWDDVESAIEHRMPQCALDR